MSSRPQERTTMSSPPRLVSLRLVIALSLLTGLLAGCVGDTDATHEPPEPASDPPPTQAEREHQARRAPAPDTESNPGTEGTTAPYTKDDWFLLSTPRHPDGHIRAFHFRIPDGAVATFDERTNLQILHLEFVPVNQNLAPGEDWDLYGFRDRDGSAQVFFALYGATLHMTNLSEDNPTDTVRPPNVPGQVYIVADEDLADGDDLYFVLVGHGDPESQIALAMRIRFGEGREAPRAAPTFAAFAAEMTTTPVTPTPVHDRIGAYKAVFGEFATADGTMIRGATANVDHEQEPLGTDPGTQEATARRLSIATDAPSGPGWTYATVQHDAQTEVIAWSLEVNAQGHHGRANGITGGVPVQGTGVIPDAATGRPSAFYLVDGDGPSYTRLTIEGAEGNHGTATYVHHGRLSAPLSEIIGIPSDHYEGLHQGAVGGIPWIEEWPPALTLPVR